MSINIQKWEVGGQNMLIKYIDNDKEIKVAVLKDILKYNFKLTPEEFQGGNLNF